MRRISEICCVIWMIFVLCSCQNDSKLSVNWIAPPDNKNIPIQGTWTIEKCLDSKFKPLNPEDEKLWKSKTAEFAKDGIRFGDYFWENPGYKIKRVGIEEYFLYNYRTTARNIGIDDKEVYVISVTSGDKFLYEFVDIKEDELITQWQDKIFTLKKVSDEVGNELKNRMVNNPKDRDDMLVKQGKPVPVGVIMGIRTPKIYSGKVVKEYSYKTLWVAWDNKSIHPVLQVDDILMPRSDGFWKVQVKRNSDMNKTEDSLYVNKVEREPVLNTSGKDIASDFWKDKNGSIYKSIVYAGNDYICLELSGSGQYMNTGRTWRKCCLQTVPVGSMQNSKGIKISDVMGFDGMMAMMRAKVKLQKTLGTYMENAIDEENVEENFALFRKSGYWTIKGKFSYWQDNNFLYSDYNINMIPSSKIVFYDTLHLPWTYIKDRIPDATDAYTSPNIKLAIVRASNALLIYTIENEKLSDTYIGKVKLDNGESIIMAEWATEDYVRYWEEVFLKNGAVRLN